MKSEGKFKCLDCAKSKKCEVYLSLLSCSGDVLDCPKCKLASTTCKPFYDMLMCQKKHLNKRLKTRQKQISDSFRGKMRLERI